MSEKQRSLRTVLVIDDEPGLCDMLRFGLPKRGYQVECALNGEEGLAKIHQANFDLVLCDIMMPGLNGVEVLRRIKDISPNTQVVMATGFATVETAIESMKRGAFDYITKPYGLPQVCAIFDRALEWKELRNRLDHLEELHRMKDEFMATISHELRTPMTVIIGYTALLRDSVHKEEDQKRGLSVIETKAKELLQIINNVIDLANVLAKREPVVLEVCSVREIYNDVMQVLRPALQAKRLALDERIPDDLFLETDRSKLKKIILHLVENAIKFTPNGRISITMGPTDHSHLLMSVEDTGIGIEADHLPVIFQEFRQVDQSHTRRYGGSGLGLAVCNRFIELLGGTISVQSKPGKGSTFTVQLPGLKPALAAPPPVVKIPAPSPVTINGAPHLLLVADDDPSFTRLFEHLLTRDGYKVMTAGGGDEALHKMEDQKPDALLLDLVMPGLTGFEVLQEMSKHPRFKGVKVFIMTSKDLTAEERAKLEPHATLIIQKGAKELSEILALIHKHLHP